MKKEYILRSSFVFILFLSFYTVLLFALYWIQIRKKDFFVSLGEKQYEVTIKTTPPRAPIYDRNDQMLALNKDIISAFIIPKKIKNIADLKAFLKKHFPQAHNRLKKNNNANFMFIKRKLLPKEIQLIKSKQIEDINLLKEPSRYYPVESAGHIIGITDIDNFGVFGLEMFFNKQLAGTPTTSRLLKDARSGMFYIEKETTVKGNKGKSVKLTIDSNLQFLCQEELEDTIKKLEAKEGCVIVLNPENGDILAIANYPGFNPNNTANLNIETTRNKAIAETYEPGSVIKIFLAMAALEEGVVNPHEIINCKNTRFTYIDNIPVSTWKSCGKITFSEVIAQSNNIGVVIIAKRLKEKLYEHYVKAGFGKKVNISLPGEQEGFINPPENWSAYSLRSLSFGYEISISLLQLVRAFSIIANNGYMAEPTIILNTNTNKNLNKAPLYSQETIDEIKNILEQAVPRQMVRQATIKGYRFMGKTGTSNILVDGEYAHNRCTYTFCGMVEKGNYKRVIATMIKDSPKKNLYAAGAAAPLFGQIAEKILIHDRVIEKDTHENIDL